jgi:hypothetical protein
MIVVLNDERNATQQKFHSSNGVLAQNHSQLHQKAFRLFKHKINRPNQKHKTDQIL